jgi:hypothetical protein
MGGRILAYRVHLRPEAIPLWLDEAPYSLNGHHSIRRVRSLWFLPQVTLAWFVSWPSPGYAPDRCGGDGEYFGNDAVTGKVLRLPH